MLDSSRVTEIATIITSSVISHVDSHVYSHIEYIQKAAQ